MRIQQVIESLKTAPPMNVLWGPGCSSSRDYDFQLGTQQPGHGLRLITWPWSPRRKLESRHDPGMRETRARIR
jgi:hypothetical protein